jgi:glutamate/tyrosine decarboxylase-like PLP-dependent enzyme
MALTNINFFDNLLQIGSKLILERLSMRKQMSDQGRAATEVLDEMRSSKASDCDWQHGRSPLYVFRANDDLYDFGREAFFEFFSENALGGGRAFPSVKRMENDVVDMALNLFNAPDDSKGFMSTGGTESIIQAVQTCREWSRVQRKDGKFRGNLVLSETAHPAFDKAAKLMDLEIRRVPVLSNLQMDVAGIEAALSDETIMMVGSAPNFSFGIIDPITELSAIALRRNMWLHVDACVGGYLAPFARQIGRDIPDFDFQVPGVCSISADLHKFGFCPKPASTIFYRDSDKAQYHAFDFSDWPNGRFFTNTLVGTRPAGGVAAAWATFQHLGIQGYLQIARELMGFIDDYKKGVSEVPGIHVLGNPHLSIVAYGSSEFDIFRVAELMSEKGWLPGLLQNPKGIHRMMSMIHAPSLEEYLLALRLAVLNVQEGKSNVSSIKATY